MPCRRIAPCHRCGGRAPRDGRGVTDREGRLHMRPGAAGDVRRDIDDDGRGRLTRGERPRGGERARAAPGRWSAACHPSAERAPLVPAARGFGHPTARVRHSPRSRPSRGRRDPSLASVRTFPRSPRSSACIGHDFPSVAAILSLHRSRPSLGRRDPQLALVTTFPRSPRSFAWIGRDLPAVAAILGLHWSRPSLARRDPRLTLVTTPPRSPRSSACIGHDLPAVAAILRLHRSRPSRGRRVPSHGSPRPSRWFLASLAASVKEIAGSPRGRAEAAANRSAVRRNRTPSVRARGSCAAGSIRRDIPGEAGPSCKRRAPAGPPDGR